jgi:hypothetical protein
VRHQPIQAAEQRRLAAARDAGDDDVRSLGDRPVEIAQDGLVAIGIAKGDPVEPGGAEVRLAKIDHDGASG